LVRVVRKKKRKGERKKKKVSPKTKNHHTLLFRLIIYYYHILPTLLYPPKVPNPTQLNSNQTKDDPGKSIVSHLGSTSLRLEFMQKHSTKAAKISYSSPEFMLMPNSMNG